jgi:riboflavin kinase/FMN adenylyltransferase
MTIGVFDGVHLGHQKLIRRVTDHDAEESIVLTFRFNPRRFLKPHLFPGDITSQRQKLDILDGLGVSTVILIDFSNDFSKLTGNEFLMKIRQSCNLTYLVLGDNFRCGFQGKTSAYDVRSILNEHGVEVEIAQSLTYEGATLSSTRIRAALSEGDMAKAALMMGRLYRLDIADIPQQRGSRDRSIEKMALHQVIPPHGQYPVEIKTTASSFPAEIVIDQECLRWKQDGGEEAVYIEFQETFSQETFSQETF